MLNFFPYLYIHTSESDATVIDFDEYACKHFNTLAVPTPTKDAYDLSASTRLSDRKVDQKKESKRKGMNLWLIVRTAMEYLLCFCFSH